MLNNGFKRNNSHIFSLTKDESPLKNMIANMPGF